MKSVNNNLNKIFNKSKRLSIDETSKIVIMSDCHRGDGNHNDDFLHNRNLYEAALIYYYNNDFTYIELGDGDEMWEVDNYNDIIENYIEIFKKIKRFHDQDRLIMIYGNHDLSKKYSTVLEEYFYTYYDKEKREYEDLLKGLKVYESLILDYKGYDIFLIHGHQVDFLNSTLWKLARFLVKYVWKSLELIGINDPTNTAKNYESAKAYEKKFEVWSSDNDKILIAGHTHRPIFPKIGEGMYFNDGSCIHPNGITCLEIENGCISLIKWEYQVKNDGVVATKRKVLEGREPIINFYKKRL